MLNQNLRDGIYEHTLRALNLYERMKNINEFVTMEPEIFLKINFEKTELSEDMVNRICQVFLDSLRFKKYADLILKDFLDVYVFKKEELPLYGEQICLIILYLAIFKLTRESCPFINETIMKMNPQLSLELFEYLSQPSIPVQLYDWGCQIWYEEQVEDKLKNIYKENLFMEMYNKIFEVMLSRNKVDAKFKLIIPYLPENRKKKKAKKGNMSKPASRRKKKRTAESSEEEDDDFNVLLFT